MRDCVCIGAIYSGCSRNMAPGYVRDYCWKNYFIPRQFSGRLVVISEVWAGRLIDFEVITKLLFQYKYLPNCGERSSDNCKTKTRVTSEFTIGTAHNFTNFVSCSYTNFEFYFRVK